MGFLFQEYSPFAPIRKQAQIRQASLSASLMAPCTHRAAHPSAVLVSRVVPVVPIYPCVAVGQSWNAIMTLAKLSVLDNCWNPLAVNICPTFAKPHVPASIPAFGKGYPRPFGVPPNSGLLRSEIKHQSQKAQSQRKGYNLNRFLHPSTANTSSCRINLSLPVVSQASCCPVCGGTSTIAPMPKSGRRA